MILLHTSDWHLGHKLYGRQRHQEQSEFLDWLLECIEEQEVDALIVAGDIFDSQSPSNQSLEMYYRFLSRAANSCCRHIIIIGGNHDSPTLLDAPRELLHFLNIHVIGRAPENIEEALLMLNDAEGSPELIVLAVPYLRDKDIRLSEAGESIEDKQDKMLHGIREYYLRLFELAKNKQQELDNKVPLIATGHLFCQGGKTRQGDGVRELYVGSLVQVGLDTFPHDIDYLALGHLHLPQRVAKQTNRRYSGAPLAMSFTEADEEKAVLLIDTDMQFDVRELAVPSFQAIASISGTLESILEEIQTLSQREEDILLEINYQGQSLIDDLQEQIHAAVTNTKLHVLRISNKRIYDHIRQQHSEIKTLEELTPYQVFQQCLDLSGIPDEQRPEMELGFAAALDALQNEEN
ncbi:Exodeoxyribonuclease I subunit D [Desulfocapsa sulfexigens DSM 10523]|uniref:Nuclease SbcCD subunit D n=1 Tax=Desulfocapsa sulfexigens (strain DSM 10523 / SB164P1) TaxID=1167006 RepID=M1P8U3_DESSD|nr:exonuclease SbcCD subunit D C-terminal domain-containing protein [Desulfocapsa sulfexigens]AGF79888.1 Exodeoxyribonuclease I subunit D [Desulfocapsa sulfexigens DSM 10523]